MASAPIADRMNPLTLWTGREFIVWGGQGTADAQPLSDGAAYDPLSDAWRRLQPSPLTGRAYAAAVWTGQEVLMWGGRTGTSGVPAADGAAYNPVTGSWRLLPAAPLAPRDDPKTVWTGTEMVVVGGEPLESPPAPAAAYNPKTNTWRSIVAPPLPDHGRMADTAVWTGHVVIYWRAFMGSGGYGNDVATYDPTSDRWHAISDPEAASSFRTHAFWCRDIAIAWGIPVPPPLTKPATAGPATGVSYEPSTDHWEGLPRPTITENSQLAAVAATSFLASDWSLNPADSSGRSGTLDSAAMDCRTKTWRPLPTSPTMGSPTAVAWAGQELLAWSAAGPSFRYRP